MERNIRTNINLTRKEVSKLDNATKQSNCRTRMQLMRSLLLQITACFSEKELAQASEEGALFLVLTKKLLKEEAINQISKK